MVLIFGEQTGASGIGDGSRKDIVPQAYVNCKVTEMPMSPHYDMRHEE